MTDDIKELIGLTSESIGKLWFESIGDRYTNLLRDVFRLSVVRNSYSSSGYGYEYMAVRLYLPV